jgi:signal peptidase II
MVQYSYQLIFGGRLKLLRQYTVLFGTAGIIIVLDQWTKALVRASLLPGEMWLPDGLDWLMPYARIINWHNTGAAFGMFQGQGWIFTLLAFLVVGLIIYYYPRVDAEDWWLRLAMGMQMGGALGNVIDRLTMGKVTDFISIGSFPVFNVADSSISVGVAILLLGVWLKEIQERKQAQAESIDSSIPSMAGREGAESEGNGSSAGG